ncbi:MAG: heme-copper oxidase subunit III [Nitrospirae bacterium]|nr:heme-copper oxidase subunit III [Nitrospirota bacterium]MBF0534582.1 heme-copper oxidase subunit III [Nitrospirota bacterium]MBF0616374.1 heme-copper oxidase subunit III [Nitrospirota bacterium]
MENVAHGGMHVSGGIHHEVELSAWPFVTAVGSFLLPISFMLAFSWGISHLGLLVAGIALVVVLVGLFGWLNEAHAKKGETSISKIAIIIFICSEVALFGGLFAGYLYTLLPAGVWPPANTPAGVPPLGLAVLMTVFLVTSSATIHNAESQLEKGSTGGTSAWLMVTTILGLAFVLCMAYEWHHLISEGFTVSTNAYGMFFFLITGLHGSHVIVGLIMQLFVLLMVKQGRVSKNRHVFATVTGLYWHFVDVVWLLVVSLIYVIPYVKLGQ